MRACFHILGRGDGLDQDEAESKGDERAVILRRLLASKCDALEALELEQVELTTARLEFLVS